MADQQERERRAICSAVPKSADFSAEDMKQMNRLLIACQGAMVDFEDRPVPQDILALMVSITNGYGCWLDTVEAAILKAPVTDAIDRAALLGSFRMAGFFLNAIHSERQHREMMERLNQADGR